jgi:hypothetical protein
MHKISKNYVKLRYLGVRLLVCYVTVLEYQEGWSARQVESYSCY